MNDVLMAIAKRSSTRGYTEQKLTKEELEQLIKAGLQAPTARNEQEIHITVVEGSDPILQEIEDEKNADQTPPSNFYYNAPVVMILSGKKDFPWTSVDAGIAVENISLAAEGLGLGSLIIGCIKDALSGSRKEYFAGALKFPEEYDFKIAIAVGHKAVSKEPHEFDMDKNVSFI